MDFSALPLSRRRFLRQSLSWSALAALPGVAAAGAPPSADPHAAHAIVVGDWGYQDKLSQADMTAQSSAGFAHVAQSQVAHGMRRYVQTSGIRPEALLMLGDSWYGDLEGGVSSPRWVEAF